MKYNIQTVEEGNAVEDDQVVHPKHYGGDGIYEVHKVLEVWLTAEQFIGYCRGQAIAYLVRADHKEQTERDLAKAVYYINRELDYRRRCKDGLIGETRAVQLIKEHLRPVPVPV